MPTFTYRSVVSLQWNKRRGRSHTSGKKCDSYLHRDACLDLDNTRYSTVRS